MTKSMIEDYNISLESLNTIYESCSRDEKPFIEAAIKDINQAKCAAISHKKSDANMLYENGEITDKEYGNFMEYMNSEENDAILKACPYMTEAALSISAALATAEARAYNSKKYNDIMNISEGSTIGTAQKNFIHSRLKKAASIKKLDVMPNKLKKVSNDGKKAEFSYNDKVVITANITGFDKGKKISVSADPAFSDSLYDAYICATCGIMTSSIKSELANAKKAWEKNKKGSERAIKEYVEEVWEESGDFSSIRKNLNMAIADGKTSYFAAHFFNRVADAAEMALYAKEGDPRRM